MIPVGTGVDFFSSLRGQGTAIKGPPLVLRRIKIHSMSVFLLFEESCGNRMGPIARLTTPTPMPKGQSNRNITRVRNKPFERW